MLSRLCMVLNPDDQLDLVVECFDPRVVQAKLDRFQGIVSVAQDLRVQHHDLRYARSLGLLDPTVKEGFDHVPGIPA